MTAALRVVTAAILLLLLSMPSYAGPNSNAAILIHLVTPNSKLNPCTRSDARPVCSSIRTSGRLNTNYYAYVLVTNCSAAAGISGVQFAVDYDAEVESGVDISGWAPCGTLDFHTAAWPAPHVKNVVTWDNINDCQRFEPGGPGNGAVAVAGYFYCSAYSADTLKITAIPDSADPAGWIPAQVSTCDMIITDDVKPNYLGFAVFSADTTATGSAPCEPYQPPALGTPAFPGAQGFGATTIAGRSTVDRLTRILHVTMLDGDSASVALGDEGSGTGSFRWCLTRPYPRTIVFDIGGTINSPQRRFYHGPSASQSLWCGTSTPDELYQARVPSPDSVGYDFFLADENRSFCTIAGQTAPGGGIQITGAMFRLLRGVHDVVIQHVRFRNTEDDNIEVSCGVHNVVFDHCSFSWAEDEIVSMAGRDGCWNLPNVKVRDITFQNCIFAKTKMYREYDNPCVPDSCKPNWNPPDTCFCFCESHAYGPMIMPGVERLSFHHNFWSGLEGRTPELRAVKKQSDLVPPLFDLVNNLYYNVDLGPHPQEDANCNVVGQFMKQGPQSKYKIGLWIDYARDLDTTAVEAVKIYLDDCRYVTTSDSVSPNWRQVKIDDGPNGAPGGYVCGADSTRLFNLFGTTTRFAAPAVTTYPSVDLPDRLLSKDPRVGAGAFPRDADDDSLIYEFVHGTGDKGAFVTRRSYEDDVPELVSAGLTRADYDRDGIPDTLENVMPGLNYTDPLDSREDNDQDGWSNLDEYLASMPIMPKTMFEKTGCDPTPRSTTLNVDSVTVTLEFTAAVVDTTAENRFHLYRQGGNDVPGTFSWPVAHRKMKFTPAGSLDTGRYFYTVESGVRKSDNEAYDWQETYYFFAVGPSAVGEPGNRAGLRMPPPAPNPFSEATRIEFELPAPGRVSLRIFDVMGREITTLIDRPVTERHNSILWAGTNRMGQPVSSGIYFIRLQAGGQMIKRKVILAR